MKTLLFTFLVLLNSGCAHRKHLLMGDSGIACSASDNTGVCIKVKSIKARPNHVRVNLSVTNHNPFATYLAKNSLKIYWNGDLLTPREPAFTKNIVTKNRVEGTFLSALGSEETEAIETIFDSTKKLRGSGELRVTVDQIYKDKDKKDLKPNEEDVAPVDGVSLVIHTVLN